MKLTKKQQQMVDDAIQAGYSVEATSEGVTIYKRHGGNKRITNGIVLFPDKTAIRADIELELALTIRTIKAMREQLGLEVQ